MVRRNPSITIEWNNKISQDRLRSEGWYPSPQDRKVVRLPCAGSSPVSIANNNTMDKTALEWFIEQLPIRILNSYHDEIEQVKKMEEEQIKSAWNDGYDKGMLTRLEKVSSPVGDANKYYKDKFIR